MIKIKLHNGECLMLIEVPDGASTWGGLYAKSTDGGESFATVRLSFYDSNDKHVSTEYLDDFYSEDQVKILGSCQNGEIDFPMDVKWCEYDKYGWRDYMPDKNGNVMSRTINARESLKTLLQSQTVTNIKYVVLIEVPWP